MSLIADSIAFARTLPVRFTDLENSVMRVLNLTGGIARAVEESAPTFVYALPPSPNDGTSAFPMAAKVATPARGGEQRLTFSFPYDIPAGLWVVAVGPARVRGVRVGNQSQDAMADFNGHVCQTKDAIPIGVVLTVLLEG